MSRVQNDPAHPSPAGAAAASRDAVYPQAFSAVPSAVGVGVYVGEPCARKLVEFFEQKGLAAIKDEDQRECWYTDWVTFQAEHQLYARLLAPKQFSSLGSEFDLLRYTRFLEVCGYFSAAHGYSLQVTFLGLFAILMGSNPSLKREAVAALEAGGLLAFGVSEKTHGSDLLSNELTVSATADGRFVANGRKYYIGNSNSAAIIAILGRKEDSRGRGHSKRALPVLFALRPGQSPGFRNVRKISTLGVRAAFVGEFEVRDHPLSETDLIGDGRHAWDAVLGTVTLGKFFLGFGSIGICEHAFEEAAAHLRARTLYGKSALEMPHIRATMAHAYARLTAMKLYAYRALDYVHAASPADRRYLLYCAVQKAKVSTEGVKVMALLSECIGARGFEAETYFEMALRDAQLIPGLESSAHINLGLTTQFIPRYFAQPDSQLPVPKSLVAGGERSGENPYLMEAVSSALNTIAFAHFLAAYAPLVSVANVRLFATQAKAFELLVRGGRTDHAVRPDTPLTLALGQCLATITYAQLIAENAVLLSIPAAMISTIFHDIVADFSHAALTLAACAGSAAPSPRLLRRLVRVPVTAGADFDFISDRITAAATHGEGERP